MRKILLPILSLVNVVLIAVAFGVAAETCVENVNGSGFANYYQIVFNRGSNVFALLSFILLVVGSALLIVNLVPSKIRKFLLPAQAACFVATGVFMLLAPGKIDYAHKLSTTGSMTAVAVLVIVAGALSCLMSVLSFMGKKESK